MPAAAVVISSAGAHRDSPTPTCRSLVTSPPITSLLSASVCTILSKQFFPPHILIPLKSLFCHLLSFYFPALEIYQYPLRPVQAVLTKGCRSGWPSSRPEPCMGSTGPAPQACWCPVPCFTQPQPFYCLSVLLTH